MRKAQRGFTLIELIMVTVILGILAATISISLGDINVIRRDISARKIMTDIRLAQNLAIARHLHTWIAFDVTLNQYTLFLENPANLGRANRRIAKDPITQGPYIISLGSPQTAACSLTSINIGGTPELEFDKYGFPEDQNGNRITTPGLIQLNGARVLSITPETGRVVMQ